MKIHAFLGNEIYSVIGMARYMFINGERIKVNFKTLCNANEVMPEQYPGGRTKLLVIDSWTLESNVKAQEIKDELKGLGCSEFLIDENTLELVSVTQGNLNPKKDYFLTEKS